MRFKLAVVVLASVAALAVLVTPASAVVTNAGGGRVSYLPLNEAAAGGGTGPQGSTVPNEQGEPPLIYHGGPVMHSQTAYAIFWVPSGYSLPSGYEAAITGYLEDVAADSGKPSNVYSVSAQYTDGTGHASYIDSFGGSATDTDAYPTSGTCAPYTGFGGESFTACITDAKMAAEVNSFVTGQGWPHGLGAEYYVVLPPEAGSCFDSTHDECFDTEFCAYHNFTASPETVYANISYSPGDVVGCGVGEYPNGHANGNVDDTLSSLSHEANESITDPKLNAWFDIEGLENGDECRNTPFEEDYGSPLGGSAGTLFNQEIGGAHYYLQQEWSNDIEDCAQRVNPPTPTIADPEEVFAGESAGFDGSGSTPGAGGIVSYHWNFGDGGEASGVSPSHIYVSTGSFTVTLTVKDDGGFSYSTTKEVNVAPLPPPLPPEASTGAPSGLGETGVTLNGSLNPEGRHTHYQFEFGTTAAYGSSTPTADAGSGLSATPVAAGLTGLTPGTTYHYRLVATNAKGTTKTADAVFTTAATPQGPSPSSSPSPQPPTPQATAGCKVPKLTGKTLAQAKAALKAANCTLGKVKEPRAKKGHKPGALVVKSSSPGSGAKPANGVVGLTLGPKPKHRKHHHH